MRIWHVPKHIKDQMFGYTRYLQTWSSCPPGRKHGCVITLNGTHPICVGVNTTNGAPCFESCAGLDKHEMQKVCTAEHAEIAALRNLKSTRAMVPENAVLIAYVSKCPCANCEQALREAGIIEVYWREASKHNPLRVIDEGIKTLNTTIQGEKVKYVPKRK